MLIRPSHFLIDSPQQMKEFLYPYYSKLFLLEKAETGKIVMLADTNSANNLSIYEDENFIIRDVRDMSKRDYFRQIIYKRCPNEVEAEMRIFNIPEKDSKSSTYLPIKTHKNFKNKKEKSCIDPTLIINHFMKIACSVPHFNDCSQIDTKPLEILVIGGSVGTLPFFIKSIYHKFANVTVIERFDKVKDFGEEYFGYKDLDVKWEVNTNPIKFIQSSYDKRNTPKGKFYDVIIINENNFNFTENVSPHPDFISERTLSYVKVSNYIIKFS